MSIKAIANKRRVSIIAQFVLIMIPKRGAAILTMEEIALLYIWLIATSIFNQ